LTAEEQRDAPHTRRAVNTDLTPAEALRPWERRGLIFLLVVFLVFGIEVERRSAFMHSARMGDLGVFLRTAWAVRAGADIYTITDEKGFHYHYPPLFAILLTPLADPPAGSHAVALPYAVSVAICFFLNLFCLALAIHWLADTLEKCSTNLAVRNQPAFCRRWWALRVWPLLACLPPIGHTLMRGQVNLLLLLLLAGTIRGVLLNRRLQAGLWLAGAICLKIIPAFLVLYPLYRRDGRCLAGCVVGLFVGLFAIPAWVFGPTRTVAYYEEWADVLVLPGLGKATDHARDDELINATATDSQSFQVVLHNTLYPNRDKRPPQASAAVRRVHWLVGGLLTALTLWLARRRRRNDAPSEMLLFGALTLLMLLLSPVCHLHYFALAVPLFMALLAVSWETHPGPHLGTGLAVLVAIFVIANSLPNFPGLERLRDGGAALHGALLLWAAALGVVWQRGRHAPLILDTAAPPRAAA
jgi:hypothetical protein